MDWCIAQKAQWGICTYFSRVVLLLLISYLFSVAGFSQITSRCPSDPTESPENDCSHSSNTPSSGMTSLSLIYWVDSSLVAFSLWAFCITFPPLDLRAKGGNSSTLALICCSIASSVNFEDRRSHDKYIRGASKAAAAMRGMTSMTEWFVCSTKLSSTTVPVRQKFLLTGA